MTYLKPLDSIRAIAVLFVIVSHWVPETHLINRIPNGAIGVDMFFVLSGFLITRILFEQTRQVRQKGIGTATLIKNFYVRRTLRIFPIYYITLGVLLLIAPYTGTRIQSSFVYFATYTSNFYFYFNHSWDGMLSHLWSLAVEEQFYLLWPWLIFFVPARHYFTIILCFIGIGIAGQYLLLKDPLGNILTFTCFDAFGLGALLAWQVVFAPEKITSFYKKTQIAAALAFALFVTGAYMHQWDVVPIRTLVSIITLWLIAYLLRQQNAREYTGSIIFNNRFLIFLGKISYGIYLYHNIIPATLNSKLVNKYINPHLPDLLYKQYWGQLYLAENILLLIGTAWLSYELIEKRFLSLKKYFQ